MTNIKRIPLCICAATFALALFTNVAFSQKSRGVDNTQSGILIPAKPFLVDNLEYPTGQLSATSTGAWTSFSGTGNFVPVSAGSLSYSGYPSSAVGNKIDLVSPTSSAEDLYRQFKIQGVGTTTYAAFMVNVTNVTGLAANASTTGDYFAGFLPSDSTTLLSSRVSIRLGVSAGTFQLGLRATSANANADFVSTDFATGTTHLVVISYQTVAGNANDVVKMWVDPVASPIEPAANLTQTAATATDISNVARFFIRQGNGTGIATPNASVDGIRVGRSWYDAVVTGAVPTAVDFNADGKADYAVTRVNGGQTEFWVEFNGSTSYLFGYITGNTGSDIPIAEDFDGDAKTDIAVWRPAPATQAAFYIFQSSTNTLRTELFGQNGDDPRVVADYDGDGKADPAVYRTGSTGAQSTWFYRGSLNNPGANVTYVPWGVGGDTTTVGDFDGDSKADFCVRRGAAGQPAVFYLRRSIDSTVEYVNWGLGDDSILPGDYDGDGRSDFVVARPNGANFNLYILERDGGGTGASPIAFASPALNDQAAFADYDGDGRIDLGIWRPNADPTQNYFWIRRSLDSTVYLQEWGQLGDEPLAQWNLSGGS